MIGHHRFRRLVRTIPPEATVAEAAELLEEEGYGCLVVADEADRPVGVLTIGDLARRVLLNGRDPTVTRVAEVMTGDLVCVQPTTSFDAALALMAARGLRRLPVVDGGRLLGLLTLNDVVQALAEEAHDLALGMRRDHESLRLHREDPGAADDWRGWPPHVIRRWHYG
jgi:CBS domain-containing protein